MLIVLKTEFADGVNAKIVCDNKDITLYWETTGSNIVSRCKKCANALIEKGVELEELTTQDLFFILIL